MQRCNDLLRPLISCAGLDKTGTLTKGEFAVLHVEEFKGNTEPPEGAKQLKWFWMTWGMNVLGVLRCLNMFKSSKIWVTPQIHGLLTM